MITKRSRYAGCILYRDGSEEFVGFRSPINKMERPDDRFHRVLAGDRIDLLAFRYLGDAKLWWVICDYNDIAFPLVIEEGRVLRIPSMEHVMMRVMIG